MKILNIVLSKISILSNRIKKRRKSNFRNSHILWWTLLILLIIMYIVVIAAISCYPNCIEKSIDILITFMGVLTGAFFAFFLREVRETENRKYDKKMEYYKTIKKIYNMLSFLQEEISHNYLWIKEMKILTEQNKIPTETMITINRDSIWEELLKNDILIKENDLINSISTVYREFIHINKKIDLALSTSTIALPGITKAAIKDLDALLDHMLNRTDVINKTLERIEEFKIKI